MVVRISISMQETERKAHEEKWGSYNDLPSGWREIPFEEGLALLGTGGYNKQEHRQPIWRDESKGVGWGFLPETHLYWSDDESGWGMTKEYIPSFDKRRGECNAKHSNGNAFIIKFYRFGCDHVWKGVFEESRMFLHVSKCKKCGLKNSVDSSG